MPTGRVLIAPDDGPLIASPTWVRLDNVNNFVSGIDIRRGRQNEQESTDTGTATVYFHDRTGLLDPANTSSAYFGKIAGKQILLQIYDPTTTTWEPQFRGLIDELSFDVNSVLGPDGEPITVTVQMECVDIFDYLGRCEMLPGRFGTTPPAGSEGIIYYKDTLDADLIDGLGAKVDRRIIEALTDAGIDSTRYVVFTGNVAAADGKYDPGDAVLLVCRDAADAELPFIANIYTDRFGRFVFHGRESRFDPDTVAASATPGAWDFMRWKAGDGTAILLDSDRAQIRVLSYTEGRIDVVNAALAWPQGMPQAQVPDNIVVDATSIVDYGYHPLPPLENLMIREGITTGLTAKAECRKYAELYVANMKEPLTRVRNLNLKALDPGDARAAATWPILTTADISDVINISVGYAGGVGIQDHDYYIEGITKQIRPLNPDYDYVSVDFDVSPAEQSMDLTGVFYASTVSPPAPADAGASTRYWGARVDGQFYQDKSYSPPSTSDAPWSGNITGGSWDLFETHTGKRVTAIHWGASGSALPSSFDTTANQRCRDRGAFSAYTVAASTSEMTDLAANTNTHGVLSKVDTWATQVKNTHYPILVRFAWEMNGNWGYPWQTAAGITTTQYKAAFSTWAARVKAIAPNVSIAWCPNVADGVTDPTPWFPSVAYGAGNIDWMFCDGYCHGTYETPSTIFDPTLTIMRGLAPGLPLGIWETGCEAPTSSPGKAAWIAALFAWLPSDVQALFWFNEYGNPALPHIEVGDSAGTLGGAAQTAFATGIADASFAANIVTTSTFPSDGLVPIP